MHSLKREAVHLTASWNNFLCFHTRTLGSSLPALRSGAIFGGAKIGLILQETERWCMVLSDVDKWEYALLPRKETTAQWAWEGVSQHLCPSTRLDSFSSSSRNANHLGELLVLLLQGWLTPPVKTAFLYEATWCACCILGAQSGLCHLEGPVKASLAMKSSHTCSTDPLTMLTPLACALWGILAVFCVFMLQIN